MIKLCELVNVTMNQAMHTEHIQVGEGERIAKSSHTPENCLAFKGEFWENKEKPKNSENYGFDIRALSGYLFKN